VSKVKTSFNCSNCGYASIRWIGCCPTCNEWNSFVEQTHQPAATAQQAKGVNARNAQPVTLVPLMRIPINTQNRMFSGIKEWDTVLGGGILPGSFLILTGDPGIGKSTLLLQVADAIATNYKVLYFSSEESLEQVKGRALRLGVKSEQLLFSDEACLESILATSQQEKPALVILDSIQNCHLSLQSHVIPGTIAQLREAAFHLMRLAKENDIAVLITGHITKEGEMAGPKVLEHMVDGVFYLQAEDRWHTRILRSVKNRFGTINEVGFFEMQEKGLVEVANVNQQFLQEASNAIGSALVCCMEGTRPLILELQALVVESKFGMPQRVVTGLDPKRVVLVAAILEKYLHIRFSAHDIFFKVSGGFKIKESSADLGIALALLSSYFQQVLPQRAVAIGEISLTGQVKAINQIAVCIKEIEKFGLDRVFVSHYQQVKTSCTAVGFKNMYDLLQLFPEGI
jgi:DNA repair protein RadA/Sms